MAFGNKSRYLRDRQGFDISMPYRVGSLKHFRSVAVYLLRGRYLQCKMATSAPNPLSVKLHPLVLLTISDHITRHSLRFQEGPIIGAIIGQQNGREVTMEYAFECKSKVDQGKVLLDEAFFATRLEQCESRPMRKSTCNQLI